MKKILQEEQRDHSVSPENEKLLSPAYFITICTHEKELQLGTVVKGKMHLSQIGELAVRYWREIPRHYPSVKLEAFIVMPNHIHGIVSFNQEGDHKATVSALAGSYKAIVKSAGKVIFRKFSFQSKVVIQQIKDKKSFNSISEYIINNPSKWRHDKFYRS
jgi:putative transposase